MNILKVFIEYSVSKLDIPFSYVCDDDILVDVGFRVLVPFHNQKIVAYVIEKKQTKLTLLQLQEQDHIAYKFILQVIDHQPIISQELFDLARFMQRQYVTSFISCLQTILPPSYKPASSALHAYHPKYLKKVFVLSSADMPTLSLKQREIYEKIRQSEGMFLKDLPIHIVKKLKELQLIEIKDFEIKDDPLLYYCASKTNHQLNEEQRKVYEELIDSQDSVFLLQGVTGSGKTEVYIQLARYFVSKKQTVIILVPEISLTPMIIQRFKEKFSRIAVLHGNLSSKEKQVQYDKIKNKEADIVIGARSAIFAPLEHIGLIILDEEHSTSYKQDKMPAYHARDIAILRAKNHGAKVLLGSATPSFESKARARKGVYHPLYLTKRANQQQLPPTEIINMREDVSDFSPLISYTLDYEIRRCLKNAEKMILLHNRRGYSPYVSCRQCGYIFTCPSCELSMSYHKNGDKFKCHYCNYEIPFSHQCPKCGGNDFLYMGSGTQKIEETLAKYYPQAKILRMDNDTTRVKNGHLKILEEFQKNDFNILLGTQMVAKGLDFHDVTLVGVINADLSLATADFRSAEYTFQLLSQVAGRAGRGEKKGRVIIQTYNPDHYAIMLAGNHDYESFFKKDMAFRSKLHYPPFSYLSSITVLCKQTDQVCILADKIYACLKEESSFELLGPALPYVYKEQEKIRMKILVKSKQHDRIIDVFNEINKKFKEEATQRKCIIQYDIDTYQLL